MKLIKCPQCREMIPDDSKFCPDCGAIIKNIDSIKKEVKNLINNNRQGYESILGSGMIPQFSEFLSIEGYEKILSYTNLIAKKQKEYDHEQSEKRIREKIRQEEEARKEDARLAELYKLRDDVKTLYDNYRDGYNYAIKHKGISEYSSLLSSENCKNILNLRAYIIDSQRIVGRKKRWGDFWFTIFIALPFFNSLITAALILLMIPLASIFTINFPDFSLLGLSPLFSLWLISYGIVCVIYLLNKY